MHNISNTIAHIQAQIQKIQNQNPNPNQDIDTNIARISTSFKIFIISSIFLLAKKKNKEREIKGGKEEGEGLTGMDGRSQA